MQFRVVFIETPAGYASSSAMSFCIGLTKNRPLPANYGVTRSSVESFERFTVTKLSKIVSSLS